jgi:hypothetical protein
MKVSLAILILAIFLSGKSAAAKVQSKLGASSLCTGLSVGAACGVGDCLATSGKCTNVKGSLVCVGATFKPASTSCFGGKCQCSGYSPICPILTCIFGGETKQKVKAEINPKRIKLDRSKKQLVLTGVKKASVRIKGVVTKLGISIGLIEHKLRLLHYTNPTIKIYNRAGNQTHSLRITDVSYSKKGNGSMVVLFKSIKSFKATRAGTELSSESYITLTTDTNCIAGSWDYTTCLGLYIGEGFDIFKYSSVARDPTDKEDAFKGYPIFNSIGVLKHQSGASLGTCSSSTTTTEYTSAESYQSELNANLKVKATGQSYTGSLSSEYTKTVNAMSNNAQVLITAKYECSTDNMSFLYSNTTPVDGVYVTLTDDFISRVKNIGQNPDDEDLSKDLYQTFGTHFISSVSLGGLFESIDRMAYSNYNQYTKESGSVSAAISYDNVLAGNSAKAGASVSYDQKSYKSYSDKVAARTVVSVPGSYPIYIAGTLNVDYKAWRTDIGNDPASSRAILKSEVLGIVDNLMTDAAYNSKWYWKDTDGTYKITQKELQVARQAFASYLTKIGNFKTPSGYWVKTIEPSTGPGAVQGSWSAGNQHRCPAGEWAVGFINRYQRDQGGKDQKDKGDDTGMNALRLRCSGGGEAKSDSEGRNGSDYEWNCCSSTAATKPCNGIDYELVGASFKILKNKGGDKKADDVGMSGVKFTCRGIKGNNLGLEFEIVNVNENRDGGRWGVWQTSDRCPQGSRICGIENSIQPWKGKDGDDSALCASKFECCVP